MNQARETPLSVLVVDDDDDLLHAMADALRDEGYVVATATDGAAALAVLEKTVVSVVVCDMSMPGIDGLAFVGMEKKSTAARSTPIVLMTGAAHVVDRPAGCVAVLSKPFKIDDLLAVVARHARR